MFPPSPAQIVCTEWLRNSSATTRWMRGASSPRKGTTQAKPVRCKCRRSRSDPGTVQRQATTRFGSSLMRDCDFARVKVSLRRANRTACGPATFRSARSDLRSRHDRPDPNNPAHTSGIPSPGMSSRQPNQSRRQAFSGSSLDPSTKWHGIRQPAPQFSVPSDYNQTTTKIDHHFSNSDTLLGRFSFTRENHGSFGHYSGLNQYDPGANPKHPNGYKSVLNWTHIFNPTNLLETRGYLQPALKCSSIPPISPKHGLHPRNWGFRASATAFLMCIPATRQ